MEKEYKSVDQLIKLLIQRGVDISTAQDKEYAKLRLQRVGYYNLINGYKDMFLDLPDSTTGEDRYKSGTKLNEIFALYTFDQKLRNIFLQYILQIETNIKCLIADIFPRKYSSDNYMLFTNFDTNQRNSNQKISNLISEVQKTIAARSDDPSIKHYLSNYGFVPLWVLNNVLTFGVISKFYSLMKQPERQYIAKKFHVTEDNLESALFYISKVRNFCAHGNRLYCFRNNFPYSDTKHHSNMNIPKITKNGGTEYQFGKRDVFAAMLIFKDLLPNKEFIALLNRTEQILNHLYKKLNVLTPQDILDSLGFPPDWKNLLQK